MGKLRDQGGGKSVLVKIHRSGGGSIALDDGLTKFKAYYFIIDYNILIKSVI